MRSSIINRFLIVAFAGLACIVQVRAQLSPGDLTTAHAELEGMSNCTQCHTLGDKVSNDKCLDCHNFIRDRINRSQGYHASTEVRGKDCISCHSEHHGRNFQITRFDESAFDHDLTGYTLTGAHAQIDCRECHSRDNISNAELRQRKNTFLGLGTECLSCHDDYHEGSLGTNCASCHNTVAFAPAAEFDHNDTDFPLLGLHTTVDCAGCHASGDVATSEIKQFAPVEHTSCASCHNDPHNGRVGANCAGCHNENDFARLNTTVRFDHNRTDFPLLGRHQRLQCAACHSLEAGATSVFSDHADSDFNACTLCHEDVHEGRFGADCRQCHTEETFLVGASADAFNHDLTEFPLEGLHVEVDCRDCHGERLTDPVVHALCADCHDDYHEGQLTVTVSLGTTDCASCHTPDGFEGSSFAFDDHARSDFPLTGAHLATPCFACHLRDDQWVFRDIGSTCVDCHENVHEGMLAQEFYPDQNCAGCHITDTWGSVNFDHSVTSFALEGKHAETRCGSCHNPVEGENTMRRIPFSGLDTDCQSCHDDPHRSQFAVNNLTDCMRCHGFAAWKPSEFDHDSAAFVLDGAHVDVSCVSCHTPETTDDQSFILYDIPSFECIDCHSE